VALEVKRHFPGHRERLRREAAGKRERLAGRDGSPRHDVGGERAKHAVLGKRRERGGGGAEHEWLAFTQARRSGARGGSRPGRGGGGGEGGGVTGGGGSGRNMLVSARVGGVGGVAQSMNGSRSRRLSSPATWSISAPVSRTALIGVPRVAARGCSAFVRRSCC